jgi:ABC-type bacteriocin/lantibiotic exporter with double-glycine peptidase domain
MPPAIATRIVPGREPNDCAICVLAMYLGVSYEDVLREVAIRDRPWQGRQGLRLNDIERIARALGTPLRRVRKYDLATAYGVLSLPLHVVLLRGGMVIDPEVAGATVWEIDDYLSAYLLRPGLLLVAKEDG